MAYAYATYVTCLSGMKTKYFLFLELIGLIIEGEDVPNNSHAFHVALVKSDTRMIFCSGSLISTGVVLTAAHCMRFTFRKVLHAV
jgi:hypothetical protein